MTKTSKRIGDNEREAAVAALRVHCTTGRLRSTEYEERSLIARGARTRGDLAELFSDLPEPRPARPMQPERWSFTLLGLTPLSALLLFFVTDSWLWFLAVPMVGVILERRPRR